MTNKKVAIFPGSFDPFTLGHLDIVQQALPMFDELIINIGMSSSKTPLLSPEERKTVICRIFSQQKKVRVEFFSGLTVEAAEKFQAQWIVRGLRTEADFSYEMPMAITNRKLKGDIQTVFFPSACEYSYVSSSLVKELCHHGAQIDSFVPEEVVDILKSKVVARTR